MASVTAFFHGRTPSRGAPAPVEDLRENWARDAEWTPAMAPELREKEYAQWKKAVTRTFAWVD